MSIIHPHQEQSGFNYRHALTSDRQFCSVLYCCQPTNEDAGDCSARQFSSLLLLKLSSLTPIPRTFRGFVATFDVTPHFPSLCLSLSLPLCKFRRSSSSRALFHIPSIFVAFPGRFCVVSELNFPHSPITTTPVQN